MNRAIKIFLSLGIVISMATCIVNCGWQLRGAKSSGKIELDHLALSFVNQSNQLRPYLQKQLQKNNVALKNDAELELTILKETLTRRPLAMNETGITIQYQLILQVDYSYRRTLDKKRQYAPKRTLFSRRSYDFDPTQINAEEREQEALLSEMREELSIRILNASTAFNHSLSNIK